MGQVRRAILSGTWYPSDPQRLSSMVDQFSGAADRSSGPTGRPVVAVVPHAGYAYSGPTAGRLYGLLAGLDYRQVFIMAPSHRARLDRIALPGATAFATPLGEVGVATETVERLAEHGAYEIDERAHAAEHAVEIQLPFLQRIWGESVRIVPMLVPELPNDRRRAAAAALQPWCDGSCLFVVSTDFTHYGSNYGYVPFTDRIPERLSELDQAAIDRILARDADGLLAHGQRTGITMCGIHAAALALTAPLPQEGQAVLIDYSRSGDRDADYSLSVSYAAILLAGPAGEESQPDKASEPHRAGIDAVGSDDRVQPGLGRDEKSYLLELARQVVTAVAHGREPPSAQEVAKRSGLPLSDRLSENRGAFVTLTVAGKLRGCIGAIEGRQPLADTVAVNASASASRDPRFPPVTAGELADIHIEISALTPLRKAGGPQDIVVGRHGIVLRKGSAQAVFLPQVATEQGWDLETTLDHLAMKAGLPPDGWRQGADFRIFEAEIFAEEHP